MTKQIKVVYSNERLITPSGLNIVGGMLGKSNFVKRCNRIPVDKKCSEPQIKDGDILLTFIGLLCQGKVDFEAVREMHDDPDFYESALGIAEAFTDEEQNDIVTLEVDNDISQGNNRWSTNGGRNTEDKVFLMSYAEAGIYFSSDNNRICRPTAYAKAQGTYVDDSGNCLWWLRSPGNTQEYTADVNADGSLGSNRYVHYDDVTVRPAMWVNMETGASFATTNR